MRRKLAYLISLSITAWCLVQMQIPAARAQGQRCTSSNDGNPVDCVPATFTTFEIPFASLPGGRLNAKGELDPSSSPADAHKGAFAAARRLGLFRNFEWLHWVPTAPSKKDPATGKWSGGDLDGFPTGWGSSGLGSQAAACSGDAAIPRTPPDRA